MIVLDIETAPVNPEDHEFAALEPWRVAQGRGVITSISLYDDQKDKIITYDEIDRATIVAILTVLQGQTVFAHNAIFDIAWLMAYVKQDRMDRVSFLFRDINWRCSMLLAKWCFNGQKAENSNFSYSLQNLVKTLIQSDEATEYVKMKEMGFNAGENAEYWKERGEQDVIFTYKIIQILLKDIPDSCLIGYELECNCLLPLANSWITGIRVDADKLPVLLEKYNNRKTELCNRLKIDESVVSSTKQLSDLLYNKWKLPILSYTPKGAPSCSADTLLWLGHKTQSGNLKDILEIKNINTIISKYLNGLTEALEHTTDGYIYGCPRIFGTYTGRFTYSNSTMKKYKFGIALHQLPRKAKDIRELLLPPSGYKIYEADASGQESRLMAIRSNDAKMLSVFQNDMNFHSLTASAILGCDYDEFMMHYKGEDGGGFYTEQRQLGKLTNLSCNYRIGGKALSEKAFTEYNVPMTIQTGQHLVKTFVKTFPGVANYWDDVIWESKSKGYVEIYGGRRYSLSDWNTDKWSTESSAIMAPIQGAGASMKEIAIYETFIKAPEAIFILDLHDASFFYIKDDNGKLDEILNNIDYSKYWGFTPQIKLPYESKFGINFSEVK